MISALLIAGPTASGKSGLASAFAGHAGATIINSDSMQVYRDLRVLTARPSEDEEKRLPHRLYGDVDAGENHSVGRWLADAATALASVRQSGRLPVFVGGTGLYFKALTQGLSDIPTVPAEVRARVRAAAAGLPPETLHQRLAALDPATAERLRPSDPQRVLRALEIFEATHLPLAQFQGRRSAPLLDVSHCLCIFLAPEREMLNAAIDRRFDAMLAAGALDEVRLLAARHLDPTLPAMRAHGVPHLLAHLSGQMALSEAARRGKLDTRHYAKRQFTFFRHQLPEFRWMAPQEAQATVLKILAEPCGPGLNGRRE
jgi:tRNA dimethylallyltransferase